MKLATATEPTAIEPTARRSFIAGTAATFASIGFVRSATSAAQSTSAAQTFKYKLGHNTPEGQAHTVRTRQMATEIARLSNGRLQLELFPNSVLGSDPAMLTQIRSGALEMLLTGGAYIAAFAPVASIDSMPFVWSSNADAIRAFDGKLGDYVRRDISAKAGLVPLPGTWMTGFREVTSSTKPIRVPADFDGFKIRIAPTKLWTDIFSSLGASPTAVTFNALYIALQTHLVDGQETPLDFIEFAKFYEVQKYLSLTNHIWATRWMLVNADAWAALPPDLQAILATASAKYARLAQRDVELLAATLVDKLQRRGMSVNATERAPFQQKLGSAFYDRWKANYGADAWALLEQYTGRLA